MKITKIKIDRFAGIHNYEASFGGNLNVIFGPNEIGKSTLMKAIKFGLFISPDITNQQLASNFGFVLDDFLPKSGGDRIDVQIEFFANGVEYKLRKTYGRTVATKFSELHFGNTQLNDHKSVQSELNIVLGISGATPKMNLKAWIDVVFANQASLSKTFDKINSTDTVKNSLAELMSQLDGISIEEFKTRVSSRLTALSQRWLLTDTHGLVLDRPELNGGRGDYDNPFVREVGLILGSYYAWKNEQKALNDRLVLEEQYDRIVGNINIQQGYYNQAEQFIISNQEFKQSLDQRNFVIVGLQNESNKLASLTEKYNLWIRLENDLAIFPVENQRLSSEIKELVDERNAAFQVQQVEQVRATVSQLNSINDSILQKAQELRGLIAVKESDLREASRFTQNLRALQIQLEAQKLIVKVLAKKAFSGVMQMGVDEPVTFNLSFGQEMTVSANTQYLVETDEFKLEVSAGEEDATVLKQRFDEFSTGLNQIYLNYIVEDYEELLKINARYTSVENEVNALQLQFDNLLAGRNFHELTEQVSQVDTIQVRSTDVLDQIIAHRRVEQSQLVQNNQRNIVQLQNFINEFTTNQNLLMAMATSKSQVNAMEGQLSTFPSRPTEFLTDKDFISHYDEMLIKKDSASSELNQLRVSRAELSSIYGAGANVDDLIESVESFRVKYESLITEGHALLKIQQKVEEIEAAIGANPFGDLEIKLASYLERLSNGRYSMVEMNDVTPKGIQKDGIVLSNHLLSQGTSDILALATRLAMADYYLGDQDGFLMLDDPMTELDDERKVFSSQLLSEVAEEKQIFVFTCHGNHKDLLGGNLVELS
jgi:DNA repair protein SbcC/Rad50